MSNPHPNPSEVVSLYREQHTKTACVVGVSKKDGVVSLLKIRDRNYEPRIKIIRRMEAGTEIAYLFDTWTGWSEGVNEHGIGVVSSALMVVNDENEKKEPTGKSRNGKRIQELLGAKDMNAAIELAMSADVSGCTFISDGKKTVLVEHDPKVAENPILKTLKDGKIVVRTNHGVFLDGAGYTSGKDLESSETRKETAEKILKDTAKISDIAVNMAKSRKKDRSHPNNVVRNTDKMTTSTQIVTVPKDRKMMIYLIPDQVTFLGIENQLPKSRKPNIVVEVFDYEKWDSDSPVPIAVKGDHEVFRLFTYGSMMAKPSYPKDVIRSYKGVLEGYHRAYNRSSQKRGDAPVVGAEAGGSIEGVIHEYPVSVAHRVLGRVDTRDGFRTEREEDANSYLRTHKPVQAEGETLDAVVYLSNPDGPNYFKPLSAQQAAKEITEDKEARKYLRTLMKGLREYGCKDSYLTDIEKRVAAKKVASRFANSRVASADWVEGFFRRHPKLRKYKGVEVRTPDKGSGSAEASQQSGRVYLWPKFWNLPPKTQDFVFAHEVGHWILSEKIGLSGLLSEASKVGLDLWDTSQLPFGQPNMDEAFAESFATYVLGRGELERRYPLWHQTIERVVR